MGKLFWIIAAGAAGYYGYRRLLGMERDIRHEVVGRGGEEHDEVASGEARPAVSSPQPKAEPSSSLEERIIRRVTETPGILQTELYDHFPEESRRTLQEALRTMDGERRMKRTREGGTYRLYPA